MKQPTFLKTGGLLIFWPNYPLALVSTPLSRCLHGAAQTIMTIVHASAHHCKA